MLAKLNGDSAPNFLGENRWSVILLKTIDRFVDSIAAPLGRPI